MPTFLPIAPHCTLSVLGPSATRAGIKLLEACLSTHKGFFMSISFFVVKPALIKIMIKPAKSHYTGRDGSAVLILLV